MTEVTNGSYIEFNYINSEGQTSYRKVKVQRIYYGFSDLYPNKQWFMDALDLEIRDTERFAMEDMVNIIDSK